jgi:hypothetical protein
LNGFWPGVAGNSDNNGNGSNNSSTNNSTNNNKHNNDKNNSSSSSSSNNDNNLSVVVVMIHRLGVQFRDTLKLAASHWATHSVIQECTRIFIFCMMGAHRSAAAAGAVIMFLSGRPAREVNQYMVTLRKAVNMLSTRDHSHLHGFAWLRYYEDMLTSSWLRQRLGWEATGLGSVSSVAVLEPAFQDACSP